MIYVINYQSGNLGAIVNMFKRIGVATAIANEPSDIEKATKIILPGVGAFDTGMQNLIEGEWIDTLNHRVLQDKVPTLGICLGMQLMTKSSEEGTLNGLGWIDAETKRFEFPNKDLKVPHMGWNRVTSNKNSKLISIKLEEEKRFYFAHSYYVKTRNDDDTLLTSEYGIQFSSAIENQNIMGVQFHPEKSHRFGMEILRNFATNY